jgi:hypothetical protein
MPKPSEFHIGVMEFFSILLPGSLLIAAIIVRWHPQELPQFRPLFAAPGASWVAFALSAYTAGHFLFLAASRLDGTLYRPYRALLWSKDDSCYAMATKAREARFAECTGANEPMNTFAGTKAMLRLKAPAACTDVERFEADSKFFRSLVVAIPLSAALVLPAWVCLALAAPAAILAVVAYADRRRKSTEWAYRYVLVLIREDAPDGAAER